MKGMAQGFGILRTNSLQKMRSFYHIAENSQEPALKPHETVKFYTYEGEFHEACKHGVGRLYHPFGSYLYGYWE